MDLTCPKWTVEFLRLNQLKIVRQFVSKFQIVIFLPMTNRTRSVPLSLLMLTNPIQHSYLDQRHAHQEKLLYNPQQQLTLQGRQPTALLIATTGMAGTFQLLTVASKMWLLLLTVRQFVKKFQTVTALPMTKSTSFAPSNHSVMQTNQTLTSRLVQETALKMSW